MRINNTQHVFTAGRTGSGKTFLARKYLAGFNHVVCLDTKGTTIWPEIPGSEWDEKKKILVNESENISLVTHLADLMKVKTPKIIYRPVFEELKPEYYDEFFRWCYRRRNCTVWVDEVMSICPNPHRIPEYYKGILTRGRELNVSVWSLTQRPSGIPQVVISESTHFFVFDLNLLQDRDKLADLTGAYELEEKPGNIKLKGKTIPCFWYYNVNREHAEKAYLKEGG